ncbi:MAG: MBL fold metallo-hydrolase [Verrucomicrobia bacterium]|nr:MBL fold metallo-hydrolase [Verrucomicrobiota bacterium]
MKIPLEDSFADIVGKAQRGLKLSDDALAAEAGVPAAALAAVKDGTFDPATLSALAPVLGLNVEALVALGAGTYQPAEVAVRGLESFNTPFEDMTVNSHLVWVEATKEAAAFDTGADASPMLEFLRQHGLTLKYLFLTHTHGDHILELDRLVEKTGAHAFVGSREPSLAGAEAFEAGKTFPLGSLSIKTRLTWGHAHGGITYVIAGLEKPLAVVGDAVFAGSMGGGAVSYADALRTNREEILTLPNDTVLAPGHGPLTTVAEQKKSNPFLAS